MFQMEEPLFLPDCLVYTSDPYSILLIYEALLQLLHPCISLLLTLKSQNSGTLFTELIVAGFGLSEAKWETCK